MATFNNDNFVATNRVATITFSGWDGKSYNGETCRTHVYTNPQYPGKEFVRTKGCNSSKIRVYHIINGQNHEVSGAPKVDVFTYFEAV